MLQTFDDPGGPALGRANLPKLRTALKALKLDGFLVPHEDEYQNEYVPPAFDRLAWLTGFTGSAGAAVVLAEEAAVFVDGRYTAQVRAQVDGDLFAYKDLVDEPPAQYLREKLGRGARVGYDPKLFSPDALERLKAAIAETGAELVPVAENPIDQAWGNARPPVPAAPVLPHSEEFAGESARSKRARIAEAVKAAGAEAVVLTSPASVAWLFNIRGGDVKATPLALATAILNFDGSAEVFLAPDKVTPGLAGWLGPDVRLMPERDLPQRLDSLARAKVMLDPALASAWFFERLADAGAIVVRAPDPVALPRACKNAVEIEGARRAHIRDGAALTRFLHWLATEGQSGQIDEIGAVGVLENFRRETGALQDLSFESISGAGPNAALPHYRVNRKTNRKLKRGNLFLIDSGGQYKDGTTDVTRTVAIGRPTPEMRDRFTRVLKGHIALARVRFPKGTTGSALDALARAALWEGGFDYDHGTGHGVGAYLGVHEGPHRISKAPNTVALEPGMIVSNEPGYYKVGHYGIRTENLQVVSPPAAIAGGERDMLSFETLTLAPIDRTLIIRARLTPVERAWLDAYHARVRDTIGPLVPEPVAAWLAAETAPI